MINLWQLKVFLEVSETGSFSAAATRLHLTQPGVSQQVRALEGQLGTQLFVRRGHGVELTPAGCDLLDPARRMINLAEVTESTLVSRGGQISGRVRLGCAITSAPYVANSWIADFRVRCPEVTVHIEHVEPGPMLGSLRAQELNGGFVLGRMRGRGLVHHKLMEDPITLIVPLNHPWTSPVEIGRAQHEYAAVALGADGHQANGRPPRHEEEGWTPAVKPTMLKEQPLVLEHGVGESHSDARRALNDALEERGVSIRDLHVVLEVPGPAAIACAVAEGIGVGLVPQSIARRFVGQVVPVRLDGFNLVQHVYLIRDRKAINSPAVGAWWKFIEEKVSLRTRESADDEQPIGSQDPASRPAATGSSLPIGRGARDGTGKKAVAAPSR